MRKLAVQGIPVLDEPGEKGILLLLLRTIIKNLKILMVLKKNAQV